MTYPPFSCVLAADSRNGIGLDGEMQWPKLRGDMEHFALLTTAAPTGMHNAVIMGRKTWLSLPPRYRPLPHRRNIVLSRNEESVCDPDVVIAGSFNQALLIAADAVTTHQIFVIGGGEVFAEAFAHPACQAVYVTRISGEFACDTFVEIPSAYTKANNMVVYSDGDVLYEIARWSRASG